MTLSLFLNLDIKYCVWKLLQSCFIPSYFSSCCAKLCIVLSWIVVLDSWFSITITLLYMVKLSLLLYGLQSINTSYFKWEIITASATHKTSGTWFYPSENMSWWRVGVHTQLEFSPLQKHFRESFFFKGNTSFSNLSVFAMISITLKQCLFTLSANSKPCWQRLFLPPQPIIA